MKKVELHKNELLELLRQHGTLRVSDIAYHLEVSVPTARRLCTSLALEERAQRVHGGIKCLEGEMDSYSFDELRSDHIAEKNRIAASASQLVENNEVIFLEAGTTLRQLALALADRIKKKELQNVVIFTNSLINLNILHPVQEKIMLIGGQYRDKRKDFVGYLSELSLKGLQFDHCFVGCDAISPTGGVMAMDIDTVRFDSELVKHTEDFVVLAHSEKFDKRSLISYTSMQEVSTIITDSGLPEELAQSCAQTGVRILCV